MINLLTILLSTMAVLFVMARAVVLNRNLPWFSRGLNAKPDEPETTRRSRRA